MKTKILWGLLAIAIAALIYIVSTMVEKYETQNWLGASAKARENPFLAAQEFLQNRDVTVISTSNTLDFDSLGLNDIVFLSNVDSMLVSQSQIDKAMNWVKRGGFLMVGVGDEIQGQASILHEFHISPEKQTADIEDILIDEDDQPLKTSDRMREINRQIEEEIQAEADSTKTDSEDKEPGDGSDEPQEQTESESSKESDPTEKFIERLLDALDLGSNYEYFQVEIDEPAFLAVVDRVILQHDYLDYRGDYSYDDEEEARDAYYTLNSWVSDENGPRLLQFAHGDGTFTAVSSAKYWQNEYIGLADHAYFLSYLVPDHATLHLFYNVTPPSINELLKHYFFELLFASFALLVLWLWHHSIRVQPVSEVIDGQRRSFTEHLGASAKFLVANKQFQALIDPLKDDIETQMRPFYPNFSQLNEAAQLASLVDRTELPEQTLQDWLQYSKEIENQDQLAAALKIGNAIRKTL